MIILKNGMKVKTIDELNTLLRDNDCTVCSHQFEEEFCNGDNPQCNGETNLSNFSFVGIEDIVDIEEDDYK